MSVEALATEITERSGNNPCLNTRGQLAPPLLDIPIKKVTVQSSATSQSASRCLPFRNYIAAAEVVVLEFSLSLSVPHLFQASICLPTIDLLKLASSHPHREFF